MRIMSNPDFASWMQHEMSMRRLSQHGLARIIDLSPGTINHWFHGRRVPDPDSCRKLAHALSVDPDTVLAAAGHRPPEVPIEEGTPAATLIELVKSVDWLRDERIYRLVRDMLDSIVIEQSGYEERRVVAREHAAETPRRLHIVETHADTSSTGNRGE